MLSFETGTPLFSLRVAVRLRKRIKEVEFIYSIDYRKKFIFWQSLEVPSRFADLEGREVKNTRMKCDDCKKEIEGTFYEVDGKTVCSKDYDEVV